MHRTSARPPPLDFLLPHSSSYNIDRRKDIGVAHSLPNLTPGYLKSSPRDGLQTPPSDDMVTAYQQSQYSNYAGRQGPNYPLAGTAGNSYAGTYSGANVQERPLHPPYNQHPIALNLRNEVPSFQPPLQRSYSRPTSPQQLSRLSTLVPTENLQRRKSANSDMILPSLQIPSSINNSGGSLAEFAAQITCLFWFESTSILQKAEKFSQTSSPARRLRPDAVPSSGFRKWVVTILSTTQVTQNVILLALLFIYRLKTINPAVKGKSGSEFRLLTVALMLGNKFLDDNTYTNKTWAEVSGISVTEIHVMEVEFLSNMRYSLLASEEQWKEWQGKLGKFWDYCDAATKAPLPQLPPAGSSFQPNLPSPPHSVQASPPSLSTLYLPSSSSLAQPPSWNLSNFTPRISPLPAMQHLDQQQNRKRSYIDNVEEPASKRVNRSANPPSTVYPSTNPSVRHDAPRLPVPNLTISTNQPYTTNTNGPSAFSHNLPQLPPIGTRAMSSVYPTTPTWGPQLPTITPIMPPSQHGSYNANGNGHITPRRQSPHSAAHDLLSIGSSPISANFPSHNSPSFYLQQRASPYKPVRHVNTLLYPPPSTSMHLYTGNTNQMHYQPLGKKNEFREGIAYPPFQPTWALPQPNFHT